MRLLSTVPALRTTMTVSLAARSGVYLRTTPLCVIASFLVAGPKGGRAAAPALLGGASCSTMIPLPRKPRQDAVFSFRRLHKPNFPLVVRLSNLPPQQLLRQSPSLLLPLSPMRWRFRLPPVLLVKRIRYHIDDPPHQPTSRMPCLVVAGVDAYFWISIEHSTWRSNMALLIAPMLLSYCGR